MSYKIGIFGGTFDPFTEAHLAIVKSAIDQKLVDKVHIEQTTIAGSRKSMEERTRIRLWLLEGTSRHNQKIEIKISVSAVAFKSCFQQNLFK